MKSVCLETFDKRFKKLYLLDFSEKEEKNWSASQVFVSVQCPDISQILS
ncbi:hypothetical protein A9K97_gp038 [Tokyovirus A1]|nr:hypothetical protein A9K97_gp038 [Tokyovirus A1]BAU80313.1 hypothetical protein [Tokyovirus A1]